MGVLDDIANNLESNLSLFTSFKMDVLSEDNIALTIKRYQSGISSRFLDKSRDDVIGFQILVKHPEQETAVTTIETIKDYLEDLVDIDKIKDDYDFISCDIYIQPLLVEKTDHGNYLYSALFQAKIHK